MKKYISLICLIGVIIIGCEKNQISTLTNESNGTRVKFINASLGVPALNYYINDTKVSPQLSSSLTDNGVLTSITTGVSYLSTFPSNEYAILTAGATSLKINTATPVPALVSPQTIAPNVTIHTSNQSFAQGKSYSVFTMGYPDAVETVVYEDDLSKTATDVAYVRFINASPTAPALDLSLKYTPTGGTLTEIIPIKNIGYKASSDFVAVPAAPTSTGYQFQTKLTGTATTLGSVIPSSGVTNLTPGRYYTIYARGLNSDYLVANKAITLKSTSRPSSAVNQPEIYYNAYGLTFYTNK